MIVGFDVFGFAAHATQILLVPALAGLLVLMGAIETHRRTLLLLSGLLLGVAFAIKQPAIYFTFLADFWPRRGC